MKIGVIFCIYNCEDYVDRCVSPWFDLKEQIDFVFTVTSGRFKDYAQLGIPNRNQSTLKKLVEWDFDFMSITGGDKLLDEDSSRNRCLDFLKPHSCDLIWLVDGDEFYTKEQIRGILDFINQNETIEGFSIWLKNYVIKEPMFINFLRPTIYRDNRIYGGIERFYFDSFFSYADQNHSINDIEIMPIPPEIAFVEHHSWLSTQANRDKIKYQINRYCGPNGDKPLNVRCSYIWDEAENKIKFNSDFYDFYSEQIPVLREMLGCYDFGFRLDFNRNQNTITIFSLVEGVYIFDVYSEGNTFFGSYPLHMSPGVGFWINPSPIINFDQSKDFKWLKIEVRKDQNLIHSEILHIHI